MASGEQIAPGGPGRGRSLAAPSFPADDGSADPQVRMALAQGASPRLARALREVRLLASVVVVADEVDSAGADTSSHMAVVSMLNERGERGLLAFTGTDSLALWNPDARPVPSLGREVARSALEEGAQAVVIDVAGPSRTVLSGRDLEVMADTLDLGRVAPLVEAALAALTADGRTSARATDARGAGIDADVVVELRLADGSRPDRRGAEQVAEAAAEALAASAALARLVPGGIGVTISDGAGSIGA